MSDSRVVTADPKGDCMAFQNFAEPDATGLGERSNIFIALSLNSSILVVFITISIFFYCSSTLSPFGILVDIDLEGHTQCATGSDLR